MSRVFVIHDNPHSPKNFSTATRWGQVEVCLLGNMSPFSIARHAEELAERLKGITKDDWLVLTGHPLLIGLAVHIMATQTNVIRVLQWDRQTGQYLPIELGGSSV